MLRRVGRTRQAAAREHGLFVPTHECFSVSVPLSLFWYRVGGERAAGALARRGSKRLSGGSTTAETALGLAS